MSSSRTDRSPGRRDDAPDGGVGRRGHRRRLAGRGRRPDRAPIRRSATSRPTRSTPRCPAPVAGVVAEILVPVDETVDVGTVLARIATGLAPDRRQTGRRRRPSRPPQPQAVPLRRARGQRCRRHAAGRGRPAPLLPRRPAHRRRARHRPLAGARAPGAVGACASRTCSRSSRTAAARRRRRRSRRCTSRARTARTRSGGRGGAGGRRAAGSGSCRGCAARSAST